MDELRAYLNSLPVKEQAAFAERCGTSIGYLRKALSTGANLGESLAIAIERESDCAVLADQIRPDCKTAFDYLRATGAAQGAA